MKKFLVLFGILPLVFTGYVFAAPERQNSSISEEYTLKPGQPLVFSNPIPREVTVQCQLHMASAEIHTVMIKALNGSGTIQGTSLKRGESLVLNLKNMQVIVIVANKGAQAEFSNLSTYAMRAVCA